MDANSRRKQIALAVLPLFAKRGFESVTTKEMAKAAKVSEGLLYRHFKSKRDIFAEIRKQVIDEVTQNHSQALSVTNDEAGLRKFIKSFVCMIATNTGSLLDTQLLLFFRSYLEDGEIVRSILMDGGFDQLQQKFVSCVRHCIDEGIIAPFVVEPEKVFWMIYSSASWIYYSELPKKPVYTNQPPHKQRVKDLVKMANRLVGLHE